MKYFKWFIFNVPILFLFWYGHLHLVEWAINISHFFLWLTAIIGTLLAFMPKKAVEEILSKSDKNMYFPYKEHLDLFYDLVTLASIVSFGFWALGAFYFISIIVSQIWISVSKKLYYK